MRYSDFHPLLREKQYELLNNANLVYFDDDPFTPEEFDNWLKEDIASRTDYKGRSWFKYDSTEFSLELADHIDKAVFKDNEISNKINNSNYSEFEELTILFMYKMMSSLVVPELKPTADEGIDFYGKFISSDKSDSSIFDVSAWYIGQTKYYKNSIGTAALRELIGTVELAKLGIWSVDENYSTIEISHSDHIIPVFITSSRYSSFSLKLSKKYKIKLLDIIDVIFWMTILYSGSAKEMMKDLNELKTKSKELLATN